MHFKQTFKNKFIATVFLLFVGISVNQAQSNFKVIIDGIIKDEDTKQPLEGAKVDLMLDGVVSKSVYTSERGKYPFNLEIGKSYIVKVSMVGYITKQIIVTTENVPDKDITSNFDVKMQVSLYKAVPGIDFSVFDKPCGSLFYDAKQSKFDYDVNDVILRKIEQLQEEYEKGIKDRQEKDRKDKEDAIKKAQADKLAAERADKDAKKQKEKEAEEKEREAKKQRERELDEKENLKKAELKAKKEVEEQEEAQRKSKGEEDRAEKKRKEKEAFELAEIAAKQKLEEKKAREEKAKEEALERIKDKVARKKAVIDKVISARVEKKKIPVQNVRTSQSEGTNYHINHTFVTIMGEEIEYRKVMFNWGGIYYKRDGSDITDVTFKQELDMYGIDTKNTPSN